MKNKKNKDEEYEGYPHYPAAEDILKKGNAEKVEADIENLDRSFKEIPPVKDVAVDQLPDDLSIIAPELKEEEEEEEEITENDLTNDDYIALNGGEDEKLKKDRIFPIDITGDGLDVPGAELDDENEEIGEEDEENNFYSEPD